MVVSLISLTTEEDYMPVTMTFSGEDVSEVFAQMRNALGGQDTYEYAAKTLQYGPAEAAALKAAVARAGAQMYDPAAAIRNIHKAAEAAMANAEQYDVSPNINVDAIKNAIDTQSRAIEKAKEQREKELSAEAEKATRQRKPKDDVALNAIVHPSAPAAATPDDVSESALETVEIELPASATTLDYTKDIAPAVIAYNTRNGREATIALLGEFGASNAKDIKPDLWPELLERLS